MAHFIPETGKENEACLLQAIYVSREQAEQFFYRHHKTDLKDGGEAC